MNVKIYTLNAVSSLTLPLGLVILSYFLTNHVLTSASTTQHSVLWGFINYFWWALTFLGIIFNFLTTFILLRLDGRFKKYLVPSIVFIFNFIPGFIFGVIYGPPNLLDWILIITYATLQTAWMTFVLSGNKYCAETKIRLN